MADETTYNVDSNQGQVKAQVTGKPRTEPGKIDVHETHVTVDRVITDANDPLAVQIPDAGRGNAITPIGSVHADGGAKSPEEVFAAAPVESAPEAPKSSD